MTYNPETPAAGAGTEMKPLELAEGRIRILVHQGVEAEDCYSLCDCRSECVCQDE